MAVRTRYDLQPRLLCGAVPWVFRLIAFFVPHSVSLAEPFTQVDAIEGLLSVAHILAVQGQMGLFQSEIGSQTTLTPPGC